MASDHDAAEQRNDRVRAAIRAVPRGRVATYGQLAMLAEIPHGHRVVAAVLKTSGASAKLPWQRVVAKHSRTKGRIAVQGDDAAEQRARLAAEGVKIDADGTISLERFGWLPLD